jgi:hypothetical protein
MEYPDAQKMVFDAAVTGVKNVLGDMAGVIVALVSIFLIVSAVKVLANLFFEHQAEDKFGEDYKTARKYKGLMDRGGVEGDIYRRKYNKLIRTMSEKE